MIQLKITIKITDKTVTIVVLINARTTIPSLVESTVLMFSQSKNFSPRLKSRANASCDVFVAVKKIMVKGATKTKTPMGSETRSIQFFLRNFFMTAAPSG